MKKELVTLSVFFLLVGSNKVDVDTVVAERYLADIVIQGIDLANKSEDSCLEDSEGNLQGYDLFSTALGNLNRDVEFMESVIVYSDIIYNGTEVDYFYNESLCNSEDVDCIHGVEWADELYDTVYEKNLSDYYATYVDGVYTCYGYNNGKWIKCKNTDKFEQYFNALESLTVKTQTYTLNNTTYYSATINSDSLPWLNEGLNDVCLDAEVAIWNDTEEIRYIVVMLPEYTDAEGRIHKNCCYNLMFDIGDQISDTHLELEEEVRLDG